MGYLRRLPRFEYLAPQSVAAACDALAEYRGEARLLAGGTDLILQMRRREIAPRYVIGLKGISGLAFIREEAGGNLVIGAMTTIHAIESSAIVREKCNLLFQVANEMGSPEIRQVATIGGNLAGALPCADFPPALIVLGAKVKLESRRGERWVPVEDFYLKFEQTVRSAEELLTAIQVPAQPAASGGVYIKFHDRHSMDMTTTGVGAFVSVDKERRAFRDVKIALGSSAPVPLRATKAEALLRGHAFTDEALEEAAEIACSEAEPRSSWRAQREFRLDLIRVLIRRALRDAWNTALGE
ncbi:MAG: xanthine dehydrogenase family protein subunit M [Deltaproteobacteria bacterium]|nr:xanthine dehydrogenase family protein subunit M [Deltaproteobacteria bacterium]